MVEPFSGLMCHEVVTNKTAYFTLLYVTLRYITLLYGKNLFYGGGCVLFFFQYVRINLYGHALIMSHDCGNLFRADFRDLIAEFGTEVMPKYVRC